MYMQKDSSYNVVDPIVMMVQVAVSCSVHWYIDLVSVIYIVEPAWKLNENGLCT